MKPAVFEYYAPTTLDEALGLLARLGDEAKVLAGGQSLVPTMNFRLARPANLVDINRVAALGDIRVEDGTLVLGAMARQRQVERSAVVAAGWPLIPEALAQVGHVQIRTRGTIGGSLAHADPAAELPAVMVALDAELVLRSARGERRLQAEAFFVGYLTTALETDELLLEVRIPRLPERTGSGFQEISRRHGDFALAGAAAVLTLDEQGQIARARLAFTGVGPTPVRPRAAEEALVGQAPSDELFRKAGEIAALDLDPDGDIHASGAYRKEVSGVMARRALALAAARA